MANSIVILGGTGFIGHNLCRLFLDRGFSVSSISLAPSLMPVPFVQYHYLDIRESDRLTDHFSEYEYDYIVNCSGYIQHLTPHDPSFVDLISTHLTSLYALVAQLSNSARLKRYIHIGSSDEYGSNPSPQSETMRELPFTAYSYSKVAATHFLQMAHTSCSLPVTIIRPFLLYGPGMSKTRFLGHLIDSLQSGQEVRLSPGFQVRDFLHVHDFFDLVLEVLSNDSCSGLILNAGSGSSVTIRDVALKVHSSIKSGSLSFGALPYRSNENLFLYPSMERVFSLLEWRPKITLDAGLSDLVSSFRNA